MSKQLEIKIRIEVLESEAQLSESERELWEKAKEAAALAYAPYSNFFVGAALRLGDGSIFTGNNQENAAYPSGLCAERTALFGKSACFPDKVVEEIAVVARKGNGTNWLPATPCGACRQVMAEYENKQLQSIKVLLLGPQGELMRINTVQDLLPLQFSKANLEIV